MIAEEIRVRRLAIPLRTPYQLSHTTLESFDVIIVTLRTGDGRVGFGELTPLDGYFEETAERLYEEVCLFAQSASGESLTDIQRRLEVGEQISLPARTPFEAGCAMLHGSLSLERQSLRVPVVGILSADDPLPACRTSLTTQVDEGYRVIKLKIGFDPRGDADCLTELTDIAPDHIAFRVDANQAYSLSDARTFLDVADCSKLQHLEQPLPVGRLEDHAILRDEFDTAILLDEEVTDAQSIGTISHTGAADRVKLKMMKQGGPRRTLDLIDCARCNDLDVVLGNGVQSDIGCLQEAAVWSVAALDTVGEFNGWLKQSASILEPAISFDDGALRWQNRSVRLADDTLAEHTVDVTQYGTVRS